MLNFNHLLGGFGRPREAARPAARIDPPALADGAADLIAYPPVDPGIPARPVDELLATQQDLIDRIKVCYGVDRLTFEQEILALIRRYAQFVHLLPATPNNYFNVPGGLLRMGLEVAFFSLQGTDGHIFSGRSTISVRRHLEPRWRHATFIAGLCCEIHRSLSHVIVTDEKGNEWQPYLQPLSTWLAQQAASRFFLKWRPNAREHRSLGVFLMPQVIPVEVMQHLASGNDVIVPHMMASISGMPLYQEHNILDGLVRRSVALVIDRYLRASADRYGVPQLGSHLERYLVDALRRLAGSSSSWNPNGDKSRIWYGSDGLFIVWPAAAGDILKLLESDQLPGIPKAPETMLEILLAAGVLEPQNASEPTWQIVPPEQKAAIEAAKLASPTILFAGLDSPPKPLAIALVRVVPGPPSSAPPAPPAEPAPPATPVSPGSSPSPVPATVTGTQHSPPAQQFPLPFEVEKIDVEREASVPPDIATNAAPDPALQAPLASATLALPVFKLNAPMRLHPAVRDALAQIVDTLNHAACDAAACAVSSGLFIPLAEFERRKIEPSLALRALADVKMLVQPEDSRHSPSHTHIHNFGAEKKVGLLLDCRYIAGPDLNPAPGDFNAPDNGGN